MKKFFVLLLCITLFATITACGENSTENANETSKITSQDSVMNWTYVSSWDKDYWHFYSPYIENNTLYIECYDVTLARSITWQDDDNAGYGFGVAEVNDSYDKKVPIKIVYDKQTVPAYEPQSFVVEVPLSNLENKRPSDMTFYAYADSDGEQIGLNFSITMSW